MHESDACHVLFSQSSSESMHEVARQSLWRSIQCYDKSSAAFCQGMENYLVLLVPATRPGLRRRADTLSATVGLCQPAVLCHLQQGVAFGHELLGGGHRSDL